MIKVAYQSLASSSMMTWVKYGRAVNTTMGAARSQDAIERTKQTTVTRAPKVYFASESEGFRWSTSRESTAAPLSRVLSSSSSFKSILPALAPWEGVQSGIYSSIGHRQLPSQSCRVKLMRQESSIAWTDKFLSTV